MKKILAIVLIVALSVSIIACNKKEPVQQNPPEPVTQAPTEPVTTPETITTPEPVVEDLGFSYHWDLNNPSNTLFDSFDADADGTIDIISYTNEAETDDCHLIINEAAASLLFSFPTKAAAVRFPGNSYFDIIVSGYVDSDDCMTYHLRYIDGEIEVVGTFFAEQYVVEPDNVEMLYVVDAFGTWIVARQFVIDEAGLLVPGPAPDTCLHTFNDEQPDVIERALTVLVDIPTVDGNTLSSGTRVLPKTFNFADETIEFIDSDGNSYIIQIELDENQFNYKCGKIPEEEAFDNLFYAG